MWKFRTYEERWPEVIVHMVSKQTETLEKFFFNPHKLTSKFQRSTKCTTTIAKTKSNFSQI